MNKKLHFLFFALLLLIVIYLCKDCIQSYTGKLIGLEPFGNQIIIHPDNANLDPQETTFSVLTYDTDLGSGVTQVGTCSDDSTWKKDDKTCRSYSLAGSNCEDIGSSGRSAFDACKVACDNCNTYQEIKRRLPSPIEDVNEPSYAQFEGSDDLGGSGDMGSADVRGIMSKLDDMNDKIGDMGGIVGAGVSAIQGESENMRIQLSSLTEGSELRDQLTRLDVDNDGFVSLDEIISDIQMDDGLNNNPADITNVGQMGPLLNNIKSRLAQFTNTLIILCESLKNNNGLSDDDKLLTTGDGVNIQDIIDALNEKDFNVVDNFNDHKQLFMDPADTAAIGAEPKMPYNIAFLYLVDKYRGLDISSSKQQFTSSVNEINTKMTELTIILGQGAAPAPDSPGNIQNKRNAALKLLEYSMGFNQFTEKVNKLSKLLLVELNRIQPPTSNANTNNPPPTTPQLDVEQLKQNAIAGYIKEQKGKEDEDDDTKFEIGAGVGVAAAVLGGLYLFSQSK